MTTATGRGTGYRSALRHRDFRWLTASLTVDQAGGWVYTVALIAYVYDQTHSAGWVGAASLARFVPALVFSAYGAVLAERFERTFLMEMTSLLCGLLMVGLATLVSFQAPVALALLLAALCSAVLTTYAPATAAITPDLVGEEDLAAANALNATIENGAVIVGPAIGALLLVVAGPAVAFLVTAATFAFAEFAVSRIATRSRPADVADGGQAGPLQQVLVGVRAIRSSSTAAVLVSFSVLASFLYGTDSVLFVVLSRFQLGTGANGFGYLLAGLGLGGLLAAALVNRLSSSPRLGTIIVVGMAVYCLPTAALVWVHSPVVAFVLEVVRGGGTLVVDVLAVTALQRSLPSDVIARVFGVFFAFVLGGISLGALLTPPLLSLFGLHSVLLIFGAGVPAVVLLFYPGLRRLDAIALARLRELAPRIAVLDALGIFAAAPRPVLERLAAAATDVTAKRNEFIVREGDPADALYVLTAGEVAFTGRGSRKRAVRLRTMTAVSYFGEIGLLERTPRTASVRALGPCRLLRIEAEDFVAALTSTPASPSFVEGARARLHRTHPTHRPVAGLPLAETSTAPA